LLDHELMLHTQIEDYQEPKQYNHSGYYSYI
jgi:hypothetical protein